MILPFFLTCLSPFVNATLITNGSFEQTSFINGSAVSGTLFNTDLQKYNESKKIWDIFYNLPGWHTSYGNGIELQKGIVSQSHDGSNHVELDSHKAGSSNSVMTQTLQSLTIGEKYLLEFYYKPRTNMINDNGINIFWYDAAIDYNFEMSATLVADSTTSLTPDWTLQSVLLTAQAESMSLSFGSSGIQNTLGGLIDNVSLKKTTQVTALSEPSMLILFLTATVFLIIRKKNLK
jgi:hypothetical protein